MAINRPLYTVHIHSGGMVGGTSLYGQIGGQLEDDADMSNCAQCVKMAAEYVKRSGRKSLEAEVRKACNHLGLDFDSL